MVALTAIVYSGKYRNKYIVFLVMGVITSISVDGSIGFQAALALFSVCAFMDLSEGRVEHRYSWTFFVIVILTNLIQMDLTSIIFGAGMFVSLMVLHQMSDNNGEPLIGGADVICVPAMISMGGLISGCISLIVVAIAIVTIGKIKKVKSTTMIDKMFVSYCVVVIIGALCEKLSV